MSNVSKLIAAMGLLAVLAAGCSSGSGAETAKTTPSTALNPTAIVASLSKTDKVTQYLGKVDGSDAYIAVEDVGNGKVRVYVCDGKDGNWFAGELKDGAFSAEDNGEQ